MKNFSLFLLVLFAATIVSQQKVTRTVSTIADMQNLVPTDIHTTVEVIGRTTVSDGGGGLFFWDNNSTTTIDNGITFAGRAGFSGRWKRINKRGHVNPLWYGAKADGVTDDITAINAAITGAAANSIGTVFFPKGNYKANNRVNLVSGVNLKGEGRDSFIDLQASTAATAHVYGTGSLSALPTISTNIVVGTNLVQFASAHGLVAGDIYGIENTTDNSWSTERPEYHAGEWFEVAGVSGTTVTNTTVAYASYATGTNISMFKMTPIRTSIKDMRFAFKPGVTVAGIQISLGADFVFDGIEATGSRYTQLYLDRCYRSRGHNSWLYDYSVAVTENYGLSIGGSQDVQIIGGFYRTQRHGISTGGGMDDMGVVNRNLQYLSLYAGTVTNSFAIDAHGNAEHVLIQDCFVDGGINVGGNRIKVNNNNIRSNKDGIALYATHLTGYDCDFNDNIFTAAAKVKAGFGFVHISQPTELRGNSVLNFCRNRIDMLDFGPTAGFGVSAVKWQGKGSGSGSEDVGINITGNNIRSDYNPGTNVYGFYGIDINAEVTGSIAYVNIQGNYLDKVGISVNENVRDLIVKNNTIIGAMEHGIALKALLTPSLTYQRDTIQGNYIIETAATGISMYTGTEHDITVEYNTSIDNGVLYVPGTVAEDSSLFIQNGNIVRVNNNYFGDRSASPTQTRVTGIEAANQLFWEANKNVGEGINGLVVSLVATDVVNGLIVGEKAYLRREADDGIAMYRGSSDQSFYLYNDRTDVNNYERGLIGWSGNTLKIGTQKLGSGSVRPIGFYTDNVPRWVINASGHLLPNVNDTYDIGSTTLGTGEIYVAGQIAIVGAAPTIASAGTISPTKGISFVSGTAVISTINRPTGFSAGGGQITLIPLEVFTTSTGGGAGGMAIATTAVVGKALIMTYDVTTTKWYPSY